MGHEPARRTSASTAQGSLAITAREQEYNGQPYTSGRIKTKGLFARDRGRFEARIKLPVGQGIWPAFWMLGVGHRPGGLARLRRDRHHGVPGPGTAGHRTAACTDRATRAAAAITSRHTIAQGGFDLGYHVFAVDWTPESITWYVDGYAYQTVTPADLPAGTDWVFDHPFFILLNVAVGGNWVGAPDSTTVFPQTMLVDYVRVYGPTS